MRVLVTGAAGFVGHHLVAHLSASGDQVITWDGPPSGPDLVDPQQVLAGLEDIDNAGRLDGVYHLAGQAQVSRSWSEPGTTIAVNTAGTANLIAALARAGFGGRLLITSSAEVYGAGAGTGPRPNLSEFDPIDPVSPYALSKAAAEQAATMLGAQAGFEVVVCRPFNQIGPGQRSDFVTSAVACRIVANERAAAQGQVAGRPRLPVGNLTAVRDFVDVRDAVVAYRLLLAGAGIVGAFNICRGEPHTIEDLVEAMVKASPIAHDVSVQADLFRPNDIETLVGSPRRLVTATGWEPKYRLEASVSDVLQEWRVQGDQS